MIGGVYRLSQLPCGQDWVKPSKWAPLPCYLAGEDFDYASADDGTADLRLSGKRD
jgi:hypothetical protein